MAFQNCIFNKSSFSPLHLGTQPLPSIALPPQETGHDHLANAASYAAAAGTTTNLLSPMMIRLLLHTHAAASIVQQNVAQCDVQAAAALGRKHGQQGEGSSLRPISRTALTSEVLDSMVLRQFLLESIKNKNFRGCYTSSSSGGNTHKRENSHKEAGNPTTRRAIDPLLSPLSVPSTHNPIVMDSSLSRCLEKLPAAAAVFNKDMIVATAAAAGTLRAHQQAEIIASKGQHSMMAHKKCLQQQHRPMMTQQEVERVLNRLGSAIKERQEDYVDVLELLTTNYSPYNKAAPFYFPADAKMETFPKKLHRLLRETKAKGQTDIISFQPHGRAFAIHDMARFRSEIMPHYFKHEKQSSFRRQLSLYCFKRLVAGPDAGSYYHELFLEVRPDLCKYIKRVGVPSSSLDRRRKTEEDFPAEGGIMDFYSMKNAAGPSSS